MSQIKGTVWAAGERAGGVLGGRQLERETVRRGMAKMPVS